MKALLSNRELIRISCLSFSIQKPYTFRQILISILFFIYKKIIYFKAQTRRFSRKNRCFSPRVQTRLGFDSDTSLNLTMGSKREEERNEKIIRGLMKLPPNRRCINCNSLVNLFSEISFNCCLVAKKVQKNFHFCTLIIIIFFF